MYKRQVQRSVHDRFVAAMTEAASRIRMGDPLDAATEIGPVANARQFAHIRDLIGAGASEGGQVIAAAPPPGLPEAGFWVAPTVLAGLSNTARSAQEEIFGPVVAAIPFDDEAEAIALANSTRFGLAGAVWTRDVGRAHRVALRVRAGVIWVNDHHKNDPRSIWGGYGESGYGKENGWDALESYMRKRSVVIRTAPHFDDWFAGGRRYG